MTELPTQPGKPSLGLSLLLLLTAVAAIIAPLLIVLHAPPVVRHRHVRLVPQRVVPQAELPPVEPMAFQDLDPDDARAFNATVPFSTDPNPAAHPFKFIGSDDQRARAIDCMAAAVLYEAGDDPEGQRAVAQVVINRARHPAFPKTICGVIFQGSERSTGCQFTFTCDGALANHRWPEDYWTRARATATAALSGAVYKPIGYSTHYHTDWVVPYWQSSLDKVAAVHTHLFFRWTGWWGTPPAFNRHISAEEPVIPAMALWSDAHKTADALAAIAADAATATAPGATAPTTAPPETTSFLLTLDPKMPPDSYAALATRICGERPYCTVRGWTSKAKTPSSPSLDAGQIASMSFSYLRDKAHGFDKALWNCSEFRRTDFSQCMKLQVLVPVATKPADGFKLESLPGATHAPPVSATLKPAAAKPQAPAPGAVRPKADIPVATKTPAAVVDGR
jgi:spore germination cell wall hydrolase CwlJ-like protein